MTTAFPTTSLQASKTAKTIAEALHYVKKFVGTRMLIKLGGSILDNKQLITQLCTDLSLLRACGIAIVLVHGGSRAIEDELRTHNIEWQFYNGQRITTEKMIDIIEMVLCGQVNKTLVRTLNAVGVPAVGLSGSDQQMLLCTQLAPELERVGKITAVNAELLEHLLQLQQQSRHAAIPVIAPIGVDGAGNAMNINADCAASYLATHLRMDKLIYLTDQQGVLDASGQLISHLTLQDCEQLIANNIVQAGMLTKVRTILEALTQGINNIHIISGKHEHALIEELFTNKGMGTICCT